MDPNFQPHHGQLSKGKWRCKGFYFGYRWDNALPIRRFLGFHAIILALIVPAYIGLETYPQSALISELGQGNSYLGRIDSLAEQEEFFSREFLSFSKQ